MNEEREESFYSDKKEFSSEEKYPLDMETQYKARQALTRVRGNRQLVWDALDNVGTIHVVGSSPKNSANKQEDKKFFAFLQAWSMAGNPPNENHIMMMYYWILYEDEYKKNYRPKKLFWDRARQLLVHDDYKRFSKRAGDENLSKPARDERTIFIANKRREFDKLMDNKIKEEQKKSSLPPPLSDRWSDPF